MKKITVLVFVCFAVIIAFGQVQSNDPGHQGSLKREHIINDSDPNASAGIFKPTRDMFDLIFEFPPEIGGGEYSVATNGEHIYTAAWNSDSIHRYEMDGSYKETITISGVAELRDLCFDGEYFYASNNSNNVFEMCFETEELIGSFSTTASFSIRGIAYDSEHDGFWVTSGWNAPIKLIDRGGSEIASVDQTEASSISGLGWENVSDGTPYLWAYSQSTDIGSRNILKQIDIETGQTIQLFDIDEVVSLDPESIAGGMMITDLAEPGKWAFLGTAQNDIIWAIELASAEETFTVTFEIEDEDGNDIDDAIVTLNDTQNEPGDYLFNVVEGNYDYIVEKVGYYTEEGEIFVDDDKTVEIVMEMEYEVVTLTLEADPEEGGTVEGGGQYQEGEEVDIVATPEDNWVFLNWSGDTDHVDDPEAAETKVTMPDDDVLLIANFEDHTSVINLKKADLTIFPNPAKNSVTVKSNEIINEVKLISVSGQVVNSIVVDALQAEFNVSNLKEGIYLIQIHTNEGTVTERIQISR